MIQTLRRSLAGAPRRALYLAGEAAWLAVAANVVANWLELRATGPLLGVPSVLLALILAALSTRLALGLAIGDRLRGILVVVGGCIVASALAFASVSSEASSLGTTLTVSSLANGRIALRLAGSVIMALVVWWRGVPGGRPMLDLDAVNGSFRTSVGVLAGLFCLNALGGSSAQFEAGQYVLPTIVALSAGLIGLPLARLQQLARRSPAGDGGGLRTSRQWLGMLLGTVGTLVVVTVVLAVILTFDRINQVVEAIVRPIAELVGLVVYTVMIPVGFLMQLLIEYLRSHLRPNDAAQNVRPGSSLLDAIRRQASTGNPDLDAFFTVLKWLFAALLVSIILWVIARAVSRYLVWSTPDDADETRDFVWSWSDAIAALRAWLRNRLTRGHAASTVTSQSTFASNDLAHPRDIRSVYRALLRLGVMRGRRRFLSETPRVYESALASLAPFVDRREDLSAITEAYGEERYGDRLTSAEKVDRAVEALRRLEAE